MTRIARVVIDRTNAAKERGFTAMVEFEGRIDSRRK
jgi:hypothetical protein